MREDERLLRFPDRLLGEMSPAQFWVLISLAALLIPALSICIAGSLLLLLQQITYPALPGYGISIGSGIAVIWFLFSFLEGPRRMALSREKSDWDMFLERLQNVVEEQFQNPDHPLYLNKFEELHEEYFNTRVNFWLSAYRQVFPIAIILIMAGTHVIPAYQSIGDSLDRFMIFLGASGAMFAPLYFILRSLYRKYLEFDEVQRRYRAADDVKEVRFEENIGTPPSSTGFGADAKMEKALSDRYAMIAEDARFFAEQRKTHRLPEELLRIVLLYESGALRSNSDVNFISISQFDIAMAGLDPNIQQVHEIDWGFVRRHFRRANRLRNNLLILEKLEELQDGKWPGEDGIDELTRQWHERKTVLEGEADWLPPDLRDDNMSLARFMEITDDLLWSMIDELPRFADWQKIREFRNFTLFLAYLAYEEGLPTPDRTWIEANLGIPSSGFGSEYDDQLAELVPRFNSLIRDLLKRLYPERRTRNLDRFAGKIKIRNPKWFDILISREFLRNLSISYFLMLGLFYAARKFINILAPWWGISISLLIVGATYAMGESLDYLLNPKDSSDFENLAEELPVVFRHLIILRPAFFRQSFAAQLGTIAHELVHALKPGRKTYRKMNARGVPDALATLIWLQNRKKRRSHPAFFAKNLRNRYKRWTKGIAGPEEFDAAAKLLTQKYTSNKNSSTDEPNWTYTYGQEIGKFIYRATGSDTQKADRIIRLMLDGNTFPQAIRKVIPSPAGFGKEMNTDLIIRDFYDKAELPKISWFPENKDAANADWLGLRKSRLEVNKQEGLESAVIEDQIGFTKGRKIWTNKLSICVACGLVGLTAQWSAFMHIAAHITSNAGLEHYKRKLAGFLDEMQDLLDEPIVRNAIKSTILIPFSLTRQPIPLHMVDYEARREDLSVRTADALRRVLYEVGIRSIAVDRHKAWQRNPISLSPQDAKLRAHESFKTETAIYEIEVGKNGAGFGTAAQSPEVVQAALTHLENTRTALNHDFRQLPKIGDIRTLIFSGPKEAEGFAMALAESDFAENFSNIESIIFAWNPKQNEISKDVLKKQIEDLIPFVKIYAENPAEALNQLTPASAALLVGEANPIILEETPPIVLENMPHGAMENLTALLHSIRLQQKIQSLYRAAA